MAEVAKRMGFRAGWSLDLTTRDEIGRPWDVNQVEMRNKAVRRVINDKPLLLICSPICTFPSCMDNTNYPRMPPEDVEQRIEYGRRHAEFCMKFYEIQWRATRDVLHEHPQTARSWHEDCVKRLMRRIGV